jgi:hypothetical protein
VQCRKIEFRVPGSQSWQIFLAMRVKPGVARPPEACSAGFVFQNTENLKARYADHAKVRFAAHEESTVMIRLVAAIVNVFQVQIKTSHGLVVAPKSTMTRL